MNGADVERRPAGRTRWARRGALLAALLLAGCAEDPTAVAPACESAPPLEVGRTVTSTLGPDDPRRGGAPIHYYSIWPAERLMVRIRMTSLAVDPFLYLFDASGRLMAQAFEPGADVTLPDAVLEATLDPGCYLVGASTWEPATGTYTLLVSAAD